jgi:CDP-glycerol glycerophosphotransferase
VAGVVPTRVKRRVRRALPRFFGPPPSTDRLEWSLDGTVATVRFRVAARGRTLTGVRLLTRPEDVAVRLEPGVPDATGHYRVQVDVAELAAAHRLRGTTLDWFLEWRSEAGPVTTRQRLGRLPEMRRAERAYRALVEVEGGEPVEVLFESTAAGNLSIRFDDPVPQRVRARSVGYAWHADRTIVTAQLATGNRAVSDGRLVALGRQSQTRLTFPVHLEPAVATSAAKFGRLHYRLQATIDFAAIAARLPDLDDTVDLAVELVLDHPVPGPDDKPVRVGLGLPRGLPEHRLRSTATDVGELSHLFVPYLTFRKHRLTYRVERFATADYRYLRRILTVAWAFPLVKPFTRIWLVGEVPYKAQDNGFHFFRYVRRTQPQRRVYYVIDKASPDRERVAALGHVVDRFSREHIRVSLLASRLVGSHHAEYLFASRDRAVARLTRGVRVFLQHGVTASKNVTLNYGRQGTFELPAEKFVVVSALERRIVMEDYGFAGHQVPITGFARYDALFADLPAPDPVITVMPTWRDSLLRAETFLESDYYANWHGFLADERLQQLLVGHGLRVQFVLHPNMRMFADYFELPNVILIRQEQVDVQQLIRTSAVLITDFSSVAWDFSFLQRPVLYFQFDQRALVRGRAPHIDFGEFLPGPIASTPERLLQELTSVVDAGCAMAPVYWERAQLFIDHRDQRNCARILDVVEHAWDLRTALARIRNAAPVQRRWRAFRRGKRYFWVMRRLFGLARLLPRRDTVVFECDRGAHYGDAPRYLYERLVERAHGLQVIWSSSTTLRLTDPATTKIKRHGPRYYWELGRAAYWVNNQNFPAELAKPTRTKFLQTWHGTPLKRMQHDVETMLSRDPGYQRRAARLTGYWDALVSGSPYATACFRSAFRFDGSVYELGYPRNDPFRWPDADDRVQATRQRLGLADDPRKIMLYAPTFRDDNRRGVNWKHELALDVERLAAEFADEWVLVVRFHQLVRQGLRLSDAVRGFVIDGSTYNDIQELMLVSDVLITDYSSLFFDYAQLRRPMLFFTYDLENYRDVLRGFYLDFEAEAPGPLLLDNGALVAALHDLDGVGERYRDRIETFAQTYGPRDDGGASDRILTEFFGDRLDTH